MHFAPESRRHCAAWVLQRERIAAQAGRRISRATRAADNVDDVLHFYCPLIDEPVVELAQLGVVLPGRIAAGISRFIVRRMFRRPSDVDFTGSASPTASVTSPGSVSRDPEVEAIPRNRILHPCPAVERDLLIVCSMRAANRSVSPLRREMIVRADARHQVLGGTLSSG